MIRSYEMETKAKGKKEKWEKTKSVNSDFNNRVENRKRQTLKKKM